MALAASYQQHWYVATGGGDSSQAAANESLSIPRTTHPSSSWQTPFADTDFWHDIDYHTASTIAKCFSDFELQQHPFVLDSNATSSRTTTRAKLEILLHHLLSKLSSLQAAVSPELLQDVNFAIWEELEVAIWTVQGRLNHPHYETTIRRLVNTSPPKPPPQQSLDLAIWRVQISLHDPKAEETLRLLVAAETSRANFDHILGLAITLVHVGNYAEAEKMGRVALAWLETTQGRASPLALSARRTIAEAVWRGGGRARRAEARRVLAEVNELVDTAICDSYGGYRAEQVKLTTDLVAHLEGDLVVV